MYEYLFLIEMLVSSEPYHLGGGYLEAFYFEIVFKIIDLDQDFIIFSTIHIPLVCFTNLGFLILQTFNSVKSQMINAFSRFRNKNVSTIRVAHPYFETETLIGTTNSPPHQSRDLDKNFSSSLKGKQVFTDSRTKYSNI
ncbi:hypothetical protein PPERSA_11741 [Pseudocohnilembus persalinus]|uniref:Uncharacterized protein n=1 Tax=Pseudocohnilembus persalinus TaxID=266149 RepID=A0A0V0QGH7_PSEPJ|nr:hypothetical protein PPERSA_11741 [Pseudocohnilembus persalinus]|eukprot:KRX01294.1 hypothetical protein PPERSA_11741 [Pseudocohnilembus persalinus]